eukprot:1142493-Pelagomonas_calceolata.AAC.2
MSACRKRRPYAQMQHKSLLGRAPNPPPVHWRWSVSTLQPCVTSNRRCVVTGEVCDCAGGMLCVR